MAEVGSADDGLSFRLLKPDSIDTGEQEAPNDGQSSPNEGLQSGLPLPQKYRKGFSTKLFGYPLKEIDHFYQGKKTFVVVSSNWEIHRFSAENSLNCLDVFNWLRWLCIRTTCHTLFRYFLIAIMLFYLTVSEVLSYPNLPMTIIRYVLFSIFFIEFMLKLVAYGFIRHPFSYYRNAWNCLDFVILIILLTNSFIIRNNILLAIESLRIMKIIQLFPFAKASFVSAFACLVNLKDFLITIAFTFWMFTIYTLNAFKGVLRNSCRPIDAASHLVNSSNSTSDYVTCGNATGAKLCPAGYFCEANSGANPDNGFTNFDNFGYAALNVLRLMTKDFWDELFTQLEDSCGSNVIVFFLVIIAMGSLLVFNLFASMTAIGVGQFFKKIDRPKFFTQNQSNNKATVTDNQQVSLENQNNETSITEAPLPEQNMSEIEIVTLQQPINNAETSTRVAVASDNEPEENAATRLIRSILSQCGNIFCGWSCCCQCFVHTQKKMADFLFHKYFDYFINVVIIFTAICMCFWHNGTPLAVIAVLQYILLAIDFLYVLEATLKIVALTPRKYFSEGWNRLDFAVAISSLADLFFLIMPNPQAYTFSIRLLRTLRLAKRWKKFRFIFKIHYVSVTMIAIVMWTMAHIGMFLFQADFQKYVLSSEEPHSWPLWHLFTRTGAFTCVIRIFAGEWIEIMWDLLVMASQPWLVYIYFLVSVALSYIMLTYLFISLVMTCLHTDDLCNTDHIVKSFHSLKEVVYHLILRCIGKKSTKDTELTNEQQQEDTTNGLHSTEAKEITVEEETDIPNCCCDFWPGKTSFRRMSAVEQPTSFVNVWMSIRRKCYAWATSSIWNVFINCFIILSCVPFVFSGKEFNGYDTVMEVTHYLVIAIFTLELAIKLIGVGCKSYFGNGWSFFDFILIIASIVVTLIFGRNVIRVLRLIPQMQCIRVVIDALIYKNYLVEETFYVVAIIWTMFAVFGVQSFAEVYSNCNTHFSPPDIRNSCSGENITWDLSYRNFDNVINAYVPLLQLATMKGWTTIWHALENPFPHMGHYSTSVSSNLYLIGFMIVGVFGCLAIIVASFIMKANEQRKEIGGGYVELLMTDSQRKKIAAQRKCWFVQPEKIIYPADDNLSQTLSRLVHNNIFDGVVILFLVMNGIILSLTFNETNPNSPYPRLMEMGELFFVVIFMVELILKLLVYRMLFFKSGWNFYDINVILTSFMDFSVYKISGTHIAPAYLFSVLRVVRLVRWLKWIKRILRMVNVCLPAILNTGMLVFVIVFYSAVTGQELFNHLEMHPNRNFDTFWAAFSGMIQSALGGGWDRIYEYIHVEGFLAVSFMLNFLIICFFIYISSGTIIFMENYYNISEKKRLGIDDESLENFKEIWQIFDPEACGTLHTNELPDFLNNLNPPFQAMKPNELRIAALDIPTNKDDRVKFGDVLQSLFYFLDKEKKVPKPVLCVDETRATTTQHREFGKKNFKVLDVLRNIRQKKVVSSEENQGLTTDD